MPEAIGKRVKWIVLADIDKINNSVAIWHPNIYITVCIKHFYIALNAFVDNRQQKPNGKHMEITPTGVCSYCMQLTDFCVVQVTFH